jgi:alpha-tubulin suppressor-like RCC1 family protein
MSMRYLGGFITASYNPLKVPNPPTIDTATPGNAQVSVAFTAPSNVGGSAITSFTVLVTDSSSGATFTNSGSASPIVVTGLTNGNTYTARVLAVNSYGPSAFSAPSGGVVPVAPAPKIFSWGLNNNGQLGQGDTANRSSPVQVGALTDWDQVSTGQFFCAAIKTNGQLWTWGSNSTGQLGQNIATTINRSSPVQVGALTDWAQVSTSSNWCAAVKTTGTLWAWGANFGGQLGQNDRLVYRSSPVQIGALTDWAQVSGGGASCSAIKTNGTLWCWGYNYFGQLGQNDTFSRSSPVQVGALTDWAQVSTGDGPCFAIKTNGTLWSWGDNTYGQLGHNDTIRRSSPVQVGALTDWAQVSAGNTFCAAVKTNGTLWSWGGLNTSGQLGQNNTINLSSPVQVGALTDWAQVSGGYFFCRAIKTNGTLWSWGQGSNGKLGLNDVANRSSPVQVGALTDWTKISQGVAAQLTVAILD